MYVGHVEEWSDEAYECGGYVYVVGRAEGKGKRGDGTGKGKGKG